MIYVSKSDLSQVEYLIEQSTLGNHVLFDPETLHEALGDGSFPEHAAIPISEEEAYAIEPELERLILKPTLEEKRAYFKQLDGQSKKRLVRTYFNIIENSLFESQKERH